jgi:hypothetical protein
MTTGNKPSEAYRKHSVLWPNEDWEALEKAARLLGEREHIPVSPVDLIKGSTMKRVHEILAQAA